MRTVRLTVSPDLKGARYDVAIHTLLNQRENYSFSKSLVRKMIMVGATYLNGRRHSIASKAMRSGDQIKVMLQPPKAPLPDAPELSADAILYREGGLIIVNKPAFLPTVSTIDNAQDNLVERLRVLLRDKTEVKKPYIGIHHRLDRDTSGCVLFTTEESANVGVAKLFQESLIQKHYLAIVKNNGQIPDAWQIKNQLIRSSKKKNHYESTTGEGSFAYTEFTCLKRGEKYALIQAKPITGRTHQIRVHLSEFGLPIVGDRFYGGEPASRLMLHAKFLSFRHPTLDQSVELEAPMPSDFLTDL